MWKADTDISANLIEQKLLLPNLKGKVWRTTYIHVESIKLVMAGTGSEDAKKVEQVMIVKI